MTSSLVGSEMCIRDSFPSTQAPTPLTHPHTHPAQLHPAPDSPPPTKNTHPHFSPALYPCQVALKQQLKKAVRDTKNTRRR
eukprot:1008829-Prorocentrum_lima.AAC.1